MKRSAPKLAVFDLDNTLFNCNSSFSFGVYLYRQGCFSFWTLLYLASCYIQQKWFGLSIKRLHQKVFKRLCHGESFHALKLHVEGFLDQNFDKLLYLPAVERLRAASSEKAYTVILSSSPNFLVGPIAARFGVTAWGATDYATDQEGKLNEITFYMEGEEKARYVVTLAEKLGVPRKDITAYSDSMRDLPLLKIAGTAVAVNPDRSLLAHSRTNQWEIL